MRARAQVMQGLSGSAPEDILKLSPDFIQELGLQQSLTPSRNNGFLNMLQTMQKKTLQLYMQEQAKGWCGVSLLGHSLVCILTDVCIFPFFPHPRATLRHDDGDIA